MIDINISINGRTRSLRVEPRMHLADLLREQLNLTATHLRCEQGACGACTILIDGQPARSCITYAAMCDGAAVQTLEGLQDDPVMTALRRAFSEEHGLQCGYCTPGMLMTARDIVRRIPDADEKRIRLELSGNLCRCTGYVGIVRAIKRVLDERRAGAFSIAESERQSLGPVGTRLATAAAEAAAAPLRQTADTQADISVDAGAIGLNGRKPNFEITQSFTVARPLPEVWAFFGDFAAVANCLPGAALTKAPERDHVEGRMSVKIGPITANFGGRARITRDDAQHCGSIAGTGIDRTGGSRAAGEVTYALQAVDGGETRVSLAIRALLAGALAQFGRSGIVEELVARITETFARNVDVRLSGTSASRHETALNASSLIWSVFKARCRKLLAKFGLR
ncbi:MAG TPA: 2Fe-2S iron-sulfur cluster-binding protein [Pseudolabrys sp.]|nr:2Fe-2S iron-sulfur cluster-binding protein [Pseudolabrys sp.]